MSADASYAPEPGGVRDLRPGSPSPLTPGGDDDGEYEMGKIFETTMTAAHWSESEGQGLPIGELSIDEDEVLDPDSLRDVDPEEEFEGYTGNAGMTIERWYRHV